MRTITGVVWNIERFGLTDRSPTKDPVIQLDFIDYLGYENKASYMVIEEFRSEAIPHLEALRRYLSHQYDVEWAYDWVKGALTVGPAAGAAPTAADTAFLGPAYSEGYLVFWRHRRRHPVLLPVAGTTSSGASRPLPANQHFVELVTNGPRVIFPGPSVTPHRAIQPAPVPAAGVTTYAFGFPGPSVKSIQQPSTGTIETRSRTAPVPPPDPNLDILSLTNVRLPVRLNVTDGAGGSIPLIVYHAPNGNYAKKYAAAACGLIPQITTVAGPVIVGGDFNLSGTNERTEGFANFNHYQLVSNTQEGGHYGRTMVHPTVKRAGRGGKQITELLPLDGNPLTEARDQVFSRGVTISGPPARTGVLPVLTDLSTPRNKLADKVIHHRRTRSLMRDLLDHNGRDLAAALGVDHASDPNLAAVVKSLRKIFPRSDQRRQLDHFETPLIAAVFYNLLISDHLPLIISIDVA